MSKCHMLMNLFKRKLVKELCSHHSEIHRRIIRVFLLEMSKERKREKHWWMPISFNEECTHQPLVHLSLEKKTSSFHSLSTSVECETLNRVISHSTEMKRKR